MERHDVSAGRASVSAAGHQQASAEAPLPRLPSDIADELSAELVQLCAMLFQTHGVAGSNFREQPAPVQDNFLWACWSAAERCNRLNEELIGELLSLELRRVQQ